MLEDNGTLEVESVDALKRNTGEQYPLTLFFTGGLLNIFPSLILGKISMVKEFFQNSKILTVAIKLQLFVPSVNLKV